MKKCKSCNLNYNTDRYTCPFCKNLLEETNSISKIETVHQEYPKFKDKIYKINLALKIFIFLSLICGITVIIANYYEYQKGIKSLWSVITLIGIATLWSLIYDLIISRANSAKRIFKFGFNLSLLILSIEYCSITSKGNYSNWSITYTIPFILIATLTAINMLVIIARKKYPSYIGYQFWASILLVMYHLLYIFNINKSLWTTLSCMLYGISTIIGIFFFGGKKTKEEFKKRFTI